MVIKEIKKEKSKTLICFDEGNYTLSSDIAAENCLRKGMDISKRQLDAFCDQSNKKEAFLKAINYLSYKRCSKKMMSDYLIKKGYSKHIADYTLKKLMDYKYIDDREYAKSYIMYSTKKGRLKLAFELKMRGIDESIINEFNKSAEQDLEQCLETAKKYLKNKDISDKKLRQKIYRHLISKGFEYSSAESVINILLTGGDDS